MKSIADGYVISVHKKTFWVRMIQISDKHRFDAEISIDKLTKQDKKLLEENVYISILKGGTIRIRRFRWTRKEIRRAEKRASKLLSSIWKTK
jgi:hypothetical protein